MRPLLLAVLVLGPLACKKAAPEVRPDNQSATEERVKCSVPDVDVITTAVKVPARCDLTVIKPLRVGAGGSLEIGAGARLSFARGSALFVDGGALTARGTAKEPVVFTSAESKKSPGDWAGITIRSRAAIAASDAAPAPGETSLEHAVIEFAGAPAALNVRGDTALAHVEIRHGSAVGLYVDGESNVKKLSAVTLGPNAVSIDAPPGVVAMLPELTGEVHLHGKLARAVTLPKRSYVVDSINVSASGSLTFADESVVRFNKEGGLSLYGSAGGTATLVAHRVTFTSALDTPAPGDWRGVVFTGDVEADLDAVIVEYAGCASKKCAAIRIGGSDKKLEIVNSTFRNNPAAAFEPVLGGSCAKWDDASLKNKSIGKPMCEDPMNIGALAMLGALGSTSSVSDVLGSKSMGDLDSVGLGAGAAMIGSGGAIGGGGGGVIVEKRSVVSESSITATGGLSVEVVRKIVRSRTGALRACHARGDDSGSITVTFAIDGKGSVTSATASSFPSAEVSSCVVSTFKSMSFPASDSGASTSATATHSYSF